MSIERSDSSEKKNQRAEQKEIIFQSDPDFLSERFFDEIRSGKFTERTSSDVEKAVSLGLSGKPMSLLTEREQEQLRECLRKSGEVYRDFVNRRYRILAEHDIYHIDGVLLKELGGQYPDLNPLFVRPAFLDSTTINSNRELINFLNILNHHKISPVGKEELIKLLADPKTTSSTGYIYESDEHYIQNHTLLSEGSGSLYSGNESRPSRYGYTSAEDFKVTLERVKQRTNKQSLTMMDIGGNVGRAIMDAKKIDPTLKTINITLASAPAIAGDIVVRRPAEYMPIEFEEKIDLIESNVAFRYFLFPDIALTNTVKALSIGGEANISFSNELSPLGENEMLERMKKVFDWLRKLEQEGYIEVARTNGDPFFVDEAMLEKQLKIVKKKPIVGI